jgi:hypothetical protein
MTNDLVKELREKAFRTETHELLNAAADRIEQLEEALRLADAALSGANMNMKIVEKKVRKALEGKDD